MSRRKLVVFLVVVLALGTLTVVGCGGDSGSKDGAYKAAMVTDVGKLGDKSFNDGVWAGMEQAKADLGAETSYLVSEQQTDYVPNLTRLTEDGNPLVVAVGVLMTDALREVATAHPDTLYAGIDIDLVDKDYNPIDLPNVREVLYAEQQVGYLAGLVAGAMTLEAGASDRLNADKVVGLVAGMKVPSVDRYIAGYIDAVKSIDPDIKILLTYTDTFIDPTAGKEAALPMYENGADIVFQVAGKTGLGVFEAAKDTGHFVIGVDVDQSPELPEVILVSAMKNLQMGAFVAVKDASEGNFDTGNFVYDLKNDGVGLSSFHDFDSIIPQTLKDLIEKSKADMVSGALAPATIVDESLVN
ncbi:MAG TPA: BMP family ABC transporter substrate-binding protein [Thermoleophilia bacterium]|nr:BMP family ABC transporter substrate-binding protein [Thermoleophilia bacterium]